MRHLREKPNLLQADRSCDKNSYNSCTAKTAFAFFYFFFILKQLFNYLKKQVNYLTILKVLQTLRQKPNLLKTDRCARNVSYTATSATSAPHIYSHFQLPFILHLCKYIYVNFTTFM